MTVAVAAGVIAVAGVNGTVTGGNVTITAADATNPRFDLIVSNSAGTLSATAGTAASNPVFPAIPASSVVIAAVYVPANDTDIDSNQIVDKRVIMAGLDTRFVNVTGDTMTGALAITLAGVGLAVTQDGYLGGYLRVGSAVAPANTTAGDLTAVRMSLGNAVLGGTSGAILTMSGTLTDTAAGATPVFSCAPTIAPAANSAAIFRGLSLAVLHAASTGVTLTSATGSAAVYFENRVRNDSLITRLYGFHGAGCIIDSASPATLSITTLVGLGITLFDRSSGTSTLTVTTGVCFDATLTLDAATLTCTTLIGFRLIAPAAGTYTTLLGMDIPSLTGAATTNIGIRVGHGTHQRQPQVRRIF